ncbi:MAG: GNAT family N-acetyltransferase [Bacteroidetes bacterium]|nr:GNAT family N-acetyltransferase [Bacteroidota bacterium]
MSVTIQACSTPSDFKKFVDFQYDLYKHNAYWVPPLKKDELNSLQPATNPAYDNCDAQFWIALKNGKVAGRVGAIINKAYNEKVGEQMCRLSRIEFIDDKEVSKALLDTAEKWAKEKGMKGIHGPLGFTNLDHQAVLIEGFDHLPSIASEYHLPYYKSHFEAAGYEKEMDWVEFRLKLEKEIPEKAMKLNEMIQKRYSLKVLHFNTRDEMKAHAGRVLQLLNTAFGDLFSFVSMSDKLQQFYIDKYFNILNPHFVKLIEDKDGNLIGFIISLPSLSTAMQKAKGKLFPFGWYYITQALKKPKVVDLLLTGIHPDWQAQGVSALLITELQKVMQKYGVEYVETTGMIETNEKAINHWKNYDHIQHKRKRCFRKMF